MWLKFHQNQRYLIFQGGRSPLLGGLTIIEKNWNYGNLPYLVANTYGLNVIKIGGIWIFQGGRSSLLRRVGLHVTCNAHFRTRMSYSSQKSCVKIWFRFVEPFKSYHLNFPLGGGINPLLGGLHVTCDAHFRTQMCYSSQKSCVRISFGLVEIGGMLSLRGAEEIGGGGLQVTYDAHFRTWPRFSRYKSCVKIWFGLVEVFKSYRGYKKKKKKK